jgi:type I restriction enzyme, S subunit
MSRSENGVDAWDRKSLGVLTEPQNLRVGNAQLVVMSCTKYRGLVPSNDYFKGRKIYSSDISNYKFVKRDWFAYATNHLAEGSIGIQDQFDEACVSPIYTVFSCAENVDPEFLFRLLKTEALVNQYKVHEQATVDRRGAIRYRDFAKIEVELPTFPEQRRIADILHTVDQAIRSTEHLIAKLQQMRQGVLNDLLARGIDDAGTLRDPTLQPEQFCDSVMGLIPCDWELGRLRDVVDKIDAGWSPACPERPPATGEWGVLKVSAVTSGSYLATEAKTLPQILPPRSEIEVSSGDVILARANGVAVLVGVTVEVLTTPPRLMLSDKLLRLRPNGSRIRGSFLALLMQSAPVRKQIGQVLSGSSGQKNISQDSILGLCVAVPPVDEQDRLIQVSRGIDDRVRCEVTLMEKLRGLKLGLSDDLLTGRVRATSFFESHTA